MVQHVIDAFGGNPFCGNAEEPITVRVVLVYENDHATLANFFKTFFNRRNRHDSVSGSADGGPILAPFAQETLDIFPDQVGFNVDFITNPPGTQISVL